MKSCIELKKYYSKNRTGLLSIFIILIAVFAVYANTLQNEFTNWDDGPLIVENLKIRSLDFENVKKIFDYKADGTYQPVRVFSYAIDYHFWGLNPVGYHIHNILLHALAAVLVYLIVLRIVPVLVHSVTASEIGSVQHIAVLTALFFAVHPVHVESVAWLSGRKYVLLSFFAFLSFYCHVLNTQQSKYSWGLGILSLITALLAVFSSPFGVVLPVLFFLYDFCRHPSNNPITMLKQNRVFYLPYGVFLVLAVPKLFSVLIMGSTRDHHMGNPFETLKTMLSVLYDYTRNYLLPFWLNARYPDMVDLPVFYYKIIVSCLFLAGAGVMLVRQVQAREKWALFCFGWMLIAWMPVSNLIPLSTKMADRYVYLASFGVFLWATIAVFHNVPDRFRQVAVKGLWIFLVVCAGLTIERNTVWRNSITLWQDSLKKNPMNIVALTDMGAAYFNRNAPEKALKYYLLAARFYPDHFAVHHNLGLAYMGLKKFEKAAAAFLRDIKNNPQRAKSHILLASAYDALEDPVAAENVYMKALDFAIDDPELQYKAGTFYASRGQYEKALVHFDAALALKPAYPQAWYDKGRVYHEQMLPDDAWTYYLKAISYDPAYPEPYNSLGNIMLAEGEYEKAEEYYHKALSIRPEYPEVLYNLGNGHALRNEFQKALEYYEKALALKPDYEAARHMIDQIQTATASGLPGND